MTDEMPAILTRTELRQIVTRMTDLYGQMQELPPLWELSHAPNSEENSREIIRLMTDLRARLAGRLQLGRLIPRPKRLAD